MTSEETGDEGAFVSASEYEDLKNTLYEIREQTAIITEERNQLREALSKVQGGIHKASEMAEGLVWTRDQKMITDLAFTLLKSHPQKLIIRYKGEMVSEISNE